jgi:hypothetical protein
MKFTSRLFGATIFTFLSSMFATFAFFLPMKSLLVLGSGDVPPFFPQVLIDGGALFVALIMLVAAVLFATLRAVSDWIANNIATKEKILPFVHSSNRFFDRNVKFGSNLLTVVLVSVLLASISTTFTISLWLWVSVVWVFSSFRVATVRVLTLVKVCGGEARLRMRNFIANGALWSTVSVAFMTLVVSEPALGITGILLSVVFGRKLQISLGKLISPESRSVSKRSNQSFLVPEFDEVTAQTNPLRYFSSAPGNESLRSFLAQRGVRGENFRLYGATSRNAIMVWGARKPGQTATLYRLLRPKLRNDALEEVSFRNGNFSVTPYPSRPTSMVQIANFPAVEIQFLSDELTVNLDRKATGLQIENWWSEVERKCLESEEFQRRFGPAPVENPGALLLELLGQMSRFPGPHHKLFQDLAGVVPALKEKISEGPKVWVPNRMLTNTDFLCVNGEVELVTFPGWRIGILGDNWGTNHKWSGSKRVLSTGCPDFELAQLRATVGRLVRALEKNDSAGILLVGKKLRDLSGRIETE